MKKRVFILSCFIAVFLLANAYAGGSSEKKTGTADDGDVPKGVITIYTSVPQPIVDRIQTILLAQSILV
jgi:hypothetical protein